MADHFMSVADWVNPDDTVDGIIIGSPEKEISRALVTWISSMAAVRDAIDRGVDLLVTHEPTFYSHRNERDYMESSDIAVEKKWTATTAQAGGPSFSTQLTPTTPSSASIMPPPRTLEW